MKGIALAALLLVSSTAYAQSYTTPVAPGGGYPVHDDSVAGTVSNAGSAVVNEIGGMSQTLNASIQNLAAVITNSQQAILNGMREDLKIRHSIEMDEKYKIDPNSDLSEYAENSNLAIANIEVNVGALAQMLSRAGESLETGNKATIDTLYLQVSCTDGFRNPSTPYLKDTLSGINCAQSAFPLSDRDITTSDYVGEDRLTLPGFIANSTGPIDLTALLLPGSSNNIPSLSRDEKMWIGAFLSCANMIPREPLPQNTTSAATDDLADAMIYLKRIAAEKSVSDRCFLELAKRTMIGPNTTSPTLTNLAQAQSSFCTNAGPKGTYYIGDDEYPQCQSSGISLVEAGGYFACRYRSHNYVRKLRQAGFEPKDIMKQLLDGPKDCLAYWNEVQQDVLAITPDLAAMPERVKHNVSNGPQQSQ